MLRSLWVSLGIHLAAFLTLLAWHARPQEPRASVSVQIEISHTKHLDSGRGKGSSVQASKSRTPVVDIPLGRLGISLASRIHTDVGADSTGDQRLGSGEILDETDRNLFIYQYLYRLIDQFTPYPEELKVAGIEGIVSADLYFTAEGRFRREQSDFHGTSNYLKVAVIRGLKNGLLEALPKTLQKFDRPFRIRCEFVFEPTEHNDGSLAASHRLITARQFNFYRSFQHSKLQWKLGPLAGLGPLPVVSLNPLWFVEKISDALSMKAKFDPLEIYREDPEW